MGMFPIGRTKEAEGSPLAPDWATERVGPTEHRVAKLRTEGERRALADITAGQFPAPLVVGRQREIVLELARTLHTTYEPHLQLGYTDVVCSGTALRDLLVQVGKMVELEKEL